MKENKFAFGIMISFMVFWGIQTIPGCDWTPLPLPSSSPSVSPTPSESVNRNRAISMASISACAKYDWKNRGSSPAGYIKGMSATFLKSACAKRSEMVQPIGSSSQKDALLWYAPELAAAGIPVRTERERMIATYTLAIGLGMRESSGDYTTGYDTSVKNHTASTAEAGLFQTSFDNSVVNPSYKTLYTEYGQSGDCMTPIFKEGVKPVSQPVIGAGPGAEFQALNKSCPAYSVEYAVTGMRVNGGSRGEWGPLDRKEVEINISCYQLLKQISDGSGC